MSDYLSEHVPANVDAHHPLQWLARKMSLRTLVNSNYEAGNLADSIRIGHWATDSEACRPNSSYSIMNTNTDSSVKVLTQLQLHTCRWLHSSQISHTPAIFIWKTPTPSSGLFGNSHMIMMYSTLCNGEFCDSQVLQCVSWTLASYINIVSGALWSLSLTDFTA